MSIPIDRLARLEAAATPGPWRQATHVEEPRALVAEHRPFDSLLALDSDGMAIVSAPADAALIATLRNAAPELIAIARLVAKHIEGYAWDLRQPVHRDGPSGGIRGELVAALDALEVKLAEVDEP